MTRFQYQRRARFWLSVLSTVLQLVAVAMLGLWLLPSEGLPVPWELVLASGIIMVAVDAFIYVMGTHALDIIPVTGKEALPGRIGKVARPLTPDGMVRVQGELWQAHSVEGEILSGEVEVVSLKDLKLLVKRAEENK
ncbi:MAG: hypothetical protein HYX87_04730 [Chloroflexi bacterium]|nr:hypothetical protein [Chloroflexota bacterium]